MHRRWTWLLLSRHPSRHIHQTHALVLVVPDMIDVSHAAYCPKTFFLDDYGGNSHIRNLSLLLGFAAIEDNLWAFDAYS